MRNEMKVVIVRGDGRTTTHLRLGRLGLTIMLGLCLALPTGAGALMGAQAAAVADSGHLTWSDRVLLAARRGHASASYLLMPRSRPPAARKAPPRPALPPVELPAEPATPESRRGHFRVQSLHHAEQIDVIPFDKEGRPNPDAFAKIRRLWRCRITGHEVPVHPKLVQLITAINDLYDRPVHLISGHRVPHTIGTSPTSQHTLGTAADIRVPGVSINTLRALATKLGARGVGLYTEKSFVHVDFRHLRKHFWSDRGPDHEVEPVLPAPVAGPPVERLAQHAKAVVRSVQHADKPVDVEL